MIRPTVLVILMAVGGAASAADELPVPLGPFGGSVRDVSPDPADPDVVLIASEPEGLLRSIDGGVHWASFGANLPDDVRLVERVPGAPHFLYAVAGTGLYASGNGGANWGLQSTNHNPVFELVASPQPGVLLLLRELALLRSDDGGVTTSTVFGGSFVRDACVSPSDPDRVYLATSVGLRRSDDGGQSFTTTAITDPTMHVIVDPTDPDRLLVGRAENAIFHQVVLSTDGGASLEIVTTQTLLRGHWSADGDQVDVLVWDGVGAFHSTSDDGGLTWDDGGSTLPPGTATELTGAPGGELFASFRAAGALAGGLFAGPPGGPLAPRGLPVGEARRVLAGPGGVRAAALSDGLWIGTGDGLLSPPTITTMVHALARGAGDRWVAGGASAPGTANPRWEIFDGPVHAGTSTKSFDPGFVKLLAASPHDPTHFMAFDGVAAGDAAAWRSTSAGLGWGNVDDLDGVVAAAFAYDPHESGRVLMADTQSRPWLSLDDGLTWFGPGVAWPGFGGPTALAYDPFVPGRLLRAMPFSGLWVSDDDGTSWTQHAGLAAGPEARLLFDPVGAGVALLVSQGDLLLTGDGFSTWETVDVSGAPLLETNTIVDVSIDPADRTVLIGTASRGAWRLAPLTPYVDLGGGTPGTGGVQPRHHGVGLARLGEPWGLGVDRAVGGTIGLLLAGVADVPVPVFGGTFHPGGPALVEVPVATSGASGAAGAGDWTLGGVLPLDPQLIGLTIVSQVGLLDAGAPGPDNKVLSNALSTTLE